MICKFCANFNYGELEAGTYQHHATWGDIVLSANRDGCEVCQIIVSSKYFQEPEEIRAEFIVVGCGLKAFRSKTNSYDIEFQLQRAEDKDRRYVTLSIFVEQSDPMSHEISSRPLWPSPLSYGCSVMTRQWLSNCRKDHTECQQLERSTLPTRVIDVGEIGALDLESLQRPHEVRLLETQGEKGEWVALSHCRGNQLPIRTNTENLANHYAGMVLEDLPPTFQEAVIITRTMGIRYLWIDALCIIQDSSEDWLFEAGKMANVYSNAVLTIAAEASPDCMTGIVESSRVLRRAAVDSVKTKWHGQNGSGTLHFRQVIPNHTWKFGWRGPLSSRGWTLQEELLSPRSLHYLDDRVLWRCAAGSFEECLPQRRQDWVPGFGDNWSVQQARMVSLASDLQSDVLEFWYISVVNLYMFRQISFEADKLVAILGLAEKVKEDIHRGLDWLTPGLHATKHSNYIAPSWSWAQYVCNRTSSSDEVIRLYYNEQLLETGTFTPLGDITEVEEHNNVWSLKIKSRYHGMCSCQVPLDFLDQRQEEHPNCAYWERTYYNNSYGDGNHLAKLGFEALMGLPTCAIPRNESHKVYQYVLFGQWYAEEPDSKVSAVVALILERIDDGDGIEKYCRVGRATIPLDKYDAEIPEWPVKTFTVF